MRHRLTSPARRSVRTARVAAGLVAVLAVLGFPVVLPTTATADPASSSVVATRVGRTPCGGEGDGCPDGVTPDGAVITTDAGAVVGGAHVFPSNAQIYATQLGQLTNVYLEAVNDARLAVGGAAYLPQSTGNGKYPLTWQIGTANAFRLIDDSAVRTATDDVDLATMAGPDGQAAGTDFANGRSFYTPSPGTPAQVVTDPGDATIPAHVVQIDHGDHIVATSGTTPRYFRIDDATGASQQLTAAQWDDVRTRPALVTRAGGAPDYHLFGTYAGDPTETDLSAATGLSLGLQPDAPDDQGDLADVDRPNNQGPYDLYIITRATNPPPIINSDGDAPATGGGAHGCTTGHTVTLSGRTVAECTLRAAIQAENAGSVKTTTISVDPALTAQHSAVIQPATPLPTLTASGVTVDLATPSGQADVTLDNPAAPGTTVGLAVNASGVVIKGLRVHGWGTGLLLGAAGHDTVVGSVLGPDSGGDTPDTVGVEVTGPGDVIGGTTPAARDVIAGDTRAGVYVHGAAASGTTITGDYIGVRADGTTVAANQVGVAVQDASGTVIGGTTSTPGTSAGNVFADANTSEDSAVDVVGVTATVTGTVVIGNTFGLAADGTTATRSSCRSGIEVTGTVQNTRLGGAAGEANVLDAGCVNQIGLDSTLVTGTQIVGNRIGTDRSGQQEQPGFAVDSSDAAIVVDGATRTAIGQVGSGNTIVGGFGTAIFVQPGVTELTVQFGAGPRVPVPGTGTSRTGPSTTSVSGNSIGLLGDGVTAHAVGIAVGLHGGGGDTVDHNHVATAVLGVVLSAASSADTVTANELGVTSGGVGSLPLGAGIVVGESPHAVVTGNTVHALGAAVSVVKSSSAQVTTNRVDVTASGNGPLTPYTGPLPEGWAAAVNGITQAGILDDADSGSALVRGNVVGSVAGVGVTVNGGGSIVDDNHVGIGLDGVTAVGNTGDGIDVFADGVTVGAGGAGTALTGSGNVVAHNGGAGVKIGDGQKNVTVRSDVIVDNAGGINLGAGANPGVTVPEATAAIQDGAGHTIVFAPGMSAGTVQIYAAANCGTGDAAGQGRALLTTLTAPGAGITHDAYAIPLQAVGSQLDETLTVDGAGTAGFSRCVTVAPSARGSLSQPTAHPGDVEQVQGGDLAPGEPVDATLHSTPIDLGVHTAGTGGTVSFSFTIPTTIELGQHYVVLTGRTSAHAIAIPLTVTAPTAPGTSSAPPPPGSTTTAPAPTAPPTTTAPTTAATPLLSATSSSGSGTSTQLATTGFDSLVWLTVGALLVVGGTATLRGSRRPR